MKLKSLVLTTAALGGCLEHFAHRSRRLRAGQGAVLPAAALPHRRLRAQRHALGQRLCRLPEAGQCPEGGINGVKIILRGMRNGLRHRQGRRVLRAPEGQARRRHAVPAAVHRHHLRADRQGAGRQDPADHRRLRPQRESQDGGVFKWNFPLARHLLGRRRRADPAHRQEGRRPGQAQGQEDRAGLPRQPVRQGADPAAAGASQGARLRTAAAAGDRAGRRAEVDLAADPPEPARLRAAVGLGRDELHRAEGGRGHRLPAREDVRRVVVRLPSPMSRTSAKAPRATTRWRCSTAPTRTPRSSKDILEATCTARARARGPKEEVGSVLYMRGAIIAMLGVEGVRRAQERFGKGKVMTGEQARWGLENLALDQKKLEALGFAGVMRPVSAPRAPTTWARPGPASTPGTARSGASRPTGTRPTSRSSSRWSRLRRPSTRAEKKLTRAHAGGLPDAERHGRSGRATPCRCAAGRR